MVLWRAYLVKFVTRSHNTKFLASDAASLYKYLRKIGWGEGCIEKIVVESTGEVVDPTLYKG